MTFRYFTVNSCSKLIETPGTISFSSDNLHKYLEDDTSLSSSSAAGLGIDENGKVAMPMLSISGSQPRTPLASSTPRLNTLVTGAQSAPGIHQAHQRSYSLSGSILGSLNSSSGHGGQGVREADDTIRDLRKENFNLKLRIYFLDERLGSKSSSGSHANQEELLNSNMELKIQCESLKNDMKEKTQLLSEASLALDQLESKLATLTDEREEEKKSLEEKLKLLESNEHHEDDDEEEGDDQDTHLIHELEEELRGIKHSSNNLKPERGCQTDHQRLQSSVLGSVPEEKDVEQLAAKIEELENSLDQMTVVIHDTETCLVEAQQKASSWQEEVSKRDSQIETLLREGRMKGEAAVKAQQVSLKLSLKSTTTVQSRPWRGTVARHKQKSKQNGHDSARLWGLDPALGTAAPHYSFLITTNGTTNLFFHFPIRN